MSTKITGFTSDNKTLGENSKFVRRVNAMHAAAADSGITADPRYWAAVAAFLNGPSDLPAFTPTF